MSIAPFAPTPVNLWRFWGTFQIDLPLPSGPTGFAPGSTTPGQLYRIDSACLILDYKSTDIKVSADLLIDLGGGSRIPFLSVSGWPHDLPDPTIGEDRYMAQLQNPITLIGNVGIFAQGDVSTLGTSRAWATLSMSSCWAPQ